MLVNNAGFNHTERSIADTSAEQWRELLDVNLTSAFVFTKAVLPEMKARGDGLIINLASRAGMYPSLLAGVGYSASKIGMEALNTVTNEEGNAYGVRASLVNPGRGQHADHGAPTGPAECRGQDENDTVRRHRGDGRLPRQLAAARPY